MVRRREGRDVVTDPIRDRARVHDAGALDDPGAGRTGLVSGGAELVQLGLEDGSDSVTCQPQEPHAPDGPERTALRERIAATAELLREERFPAVAGDHCRDCGFLPLCPVKSPGSVVER